jgi:hypothetical protein
MPIKDAKGPACSKKTPHLFIFKQKRGLKALLAGVHT